MKPAFAQAWLDTETHIDQLTPKQRRAVRALCEKFFNAGDRYRLRKGTSDERQPQIPHEQAR